MHFWQGLVKLTEICDLFVSGTEFFVGLLIERFEVVSILVIFALEFDVKASDIGNKKSPEDLIQFLDSDFLESILKKTPNILDGLRLLIDIVSLKVGPILVGFASEVLSFLTKSSKFLVFHLLYLVSSEWLFHGSQIVEHKVHSRLKIFGTILGGLHNDMARQCLVSTVKHGLNNVTELLFVSELIKEWLVHQTHKAFHYGIIIVGEFSELEVA